jgi:hypothetical protein
VVGPRSNSAARQQKDRPARPGSYLRYHRLSGHLELRSGRQLPLLRDVDFEFAGSQARAAQIVSEWGPKGRSAAYLSLLLDYGYMFSYGVFFALAGFMVRDAARARDWRRLAAIGVFVPFFALAAASFDASENVALLLTLAGNGGSFAPPFAAVCSAIKFTLISITILYALSGLVLWLRTRQPQPT